MDFKLSTRKADSVSVVDLMGRMTAGEALMAFRQTIRDEIAKGNNKILLNLKDVSYIDSSGLGELVMALGTVTQTICAKCGAILPASEPEGPDPLIGAVVGGRFRITGILGEGGMGRAYTGEQQMGTSVRKVAVKTLLSQYAKDPQVLARFMRECGTVSELEHPNTIKVHDFGQTDSGELYIATAKPAGLRLPPPGFTRVAKMSELVTDRVSAHVTR